MSKQYSNPGNKSSAAQWWSRPPLAMVIAAVTKEARFREGAPDCPNSAAGLESRNKWTTLARAAIGHQSPLPMGLFSFVAAFGNRFAQSIKLIYPMPQIDKMVARTSRV
jgi:hypothetical protein